MTPCRATHSASGTGLNPASSCSQEARHPEPTKWWLPSPSRMPRSVSTTVGMRRCRDSRAAVELMVTRRSVRSSTSPMCPYTRLKLAGEFLALDQFLVGQLLDVRGVFAGLGAQLEQYLAARVETGVLDRPVEQVVAVPAVVGHRGLHREDDRVRVVLTGVGGSAEERQGDLGDRGGVGADTVVDRLETVRVLTGVGEDEGAVSQQQAVGELLVDDADIAGDDHGPLAAPVPGAGQPVQHRLDPAADEGEHEDVVRLRLHGAQELDGGHLAEGVGGDADFLQLAGCWGGTTPQEVPVQRDVRIRRSNAVRGERTPFPPGVGIREDGDSQGLRCTCWHTEDARKPFR